MTLRWRSFKFGRLLGQFLALILVLFALMVSLIRGLLPQLDAERLEQYVAEQYGVQVELGRLSAKWQAYGPSVNIDSVTLPEQGELPVSFNINNVQIKLDFWQTLLTLSPQVENVNFGNVYLALDLDKIGGDERNAPAVQPLHKTHLDWLYSLLLEQLQQYSIDNATVQLLSASHQYRPIQLQQLRWLNHGEKHRANGALYLDKVPMGGQHLLLNVDLSGNGNKPDSIKGQLYLAANELNLGAWASEHSKALDEPLSIPLQGVVNLQAWFDVAHRSIERGLVQFGHSVLDWQQQDEQQNFTIDGGQLLWQKRADGWQLSSRDLAFSSNQQPWQDFSIYAAKRQQQLFGHVSSFALEQLRPLVPLIPAITPEHLSQLLALDAKGQVEQLQLYQAANEPLQLQVPIKSLSWQAVAAIPGSEPIDIELGSHGSFLSARLPAQHYQLSFTDQFNGPIAVDGEAIDVGFDTASQQLLVPSLVLNNADLSLDASARLSFADTPDLSLTASLALHDLSQAHRYFPIKAMGEDLSHYLTEAIKAGHSEDARVVWRGPLSGFPYAEHQGVFQAAFTLQEGTFAFQPDWPAADKLTLAALFENDSMAIDVQQGMLKKVDISGAQVSIPTMDAHSHLIVNADLHANGPDVTQVIAQSPLTSVSSTLNVINIRDAINGSLALDIPLYAGGKPDIHGKVVLDNNTVYVSKPGVLLRKLNGEVTFDNDVVHSDKITGLMYQQPLRMDFTTGRNNDDFGVTVHLDGDWDLDKLPQELNNPLQSFYAGKMRWKGYLQLIFDEGGFRIQANADTDLKRSELTLPAPFNKAKGQTLKVSAELLGDNKQASLGIRMADLAEFWGSFDVTEERLKHYDIMLGRLFRSGDQLNKADGKLWLALKDTQFSDWQPVIESFLDFNKPAADSQTAANRAASDTPATAKPATTESTVASTATASHAAAKRGFFPPLVAIGGTVAQLDMLGQRFTQVSLDAQDTQSSWLFNIDAPAFAGSIEIFPDWWQQGLKVVASRVYLNATPPLVAANGAAPAVDNALTQLPPLALDIADFSYQGRSLGHLVMQGAPAPKGYHFQMFSLNAPQGNLQGSGDWITEGNNRTSVKFALDAENFEKLAAVFDVTPGVKDSPLKVKAELDWAGGPSDFNLSSLSGKVRFDLGKGHMEQLSDKGARIFSLFSLDSILRKLSLDFSDVFGKGLYFNSFNGDLALDNGILQTTNTEMDAVAGTMKVRGYTNLVSESLNYDISFAPKLASSVPTVVLLSTSAWTMGIGAFALTKVLEPVIEVISEIRFRLTGTISEPKLEELERKSKEIEIPKSILPEDKQGEAGAEDNNLGPDSDASTDSQAPAANAPTPSEHTPTVASQSPSTQANSAPLSVTSAANDDTVAPVTPSPSKETQHASESVTVPEQPQARRESGVYPAAA